MLLFAVADLLQITGSCSKRDTSAILHFEIVVQTLYMVDA